MPDAPFLENKKQATFAQSQRVEGLAVFKSAATFALHAFTYHGLLGAVPVPAPNRQAVLPHVPFPTL